MVSKQTLSKEALQVVRKARAKVLGMKSCNVGEESKEAMKRSLRGVE